MATDDVGREVVLGIAHRVGHVGVGRQVKDDLLPFDGGLSGGGVAHVADDETGGRQRPGFLWA